MMRTAQKLPLVAAATLSLCGCFGGDDDNDSTPTKVLSPGFYVGDYKGYDTAGRWESEFTLNKDGTYRFYWILDNEPVGDIKGSWHQWADSLYFDKSGETYMNQMGVFEPHMAAEDDTNSIRNITDSSFMRKEWTFIRQKPLWVTYKKKNAGALGNGKYEYSWDLEVDSVTKVPVKVGISINGTGFLYSYKEDNLESYQARADWYLLGSVLTTEGNQRRSYVDSLKTFSDWRPMSGALLQRVRVSDTALELWFPGDWATPPGWEVYRKVE